MTQRSVFLFGLAIGAWLNIWFGLAGGWWSFIFAYVLVAICVVSTAVERAWR